MNNRLPILFRCDASEQSGFESFYQCLTYAAALQRRRRTTYFLSNLQPNSLAGSIQRAGNDWRATEHVLGSEQDLEATLRTIRDLQIAAVIVSDPRASSDYLAALSQSGAYLVVLDSQAAGRFPAGLLVNPLLGPSRDSYLVERNCQVLMGARYSFVRPFVRRMRPVRAQEPPAPFRALIALGEDDSRNQTVRRVQELLAISRLERIDVAVRAHHQAVPELLKLKEEYPERLDVVTEPADISLRIGRCHLAITSGDSWSLELACVGVPQLLLVQSARHLLNAQRLDDEGAATNLGDCDSVSAGQLRQAVQNLLSEPRERTAMARSGRKLIDGRGPDRLVNALEIMLARPEATREIERSAAA